MRESGRTSRRTGMISSPLPSASRMSMTAKAGAMRRKTVVASATEAAQWGANPRRSHGAAQPIAHSDIIVEDEQFLRQLVRRLIMRLAHRVHRRNPKLYPLDQE